MRIRTVALIGGCVLAVAACGSTGGKAASASRPATPVNLTVYVNNQRVSVSPASVGAGPVVFIVTNQAKTAQALSVSPAGGGHTLARTAPINPQGTTQFSVDFHPGTYTISIASPGSTDAALSVTPPIRPASIHIGRQRGSSSGQLLQP